MRHWLLLSFIFLGGLAYWAAGDYLLRPHPSRVGSPPADLGAIEVCIPATGPSCIAGWFAVEPDARGVALLMHGSGADRRAMLGRARFLQSLGWSVLLIDLQAHGETAGNHKSAGLLESRDAASALHWLRRQQPQSPLLIVGYSLGGVASVLGAAATQADAMILEAIYKDLPSAIDHRLEVYLGRFGPWLTPLLGIQFELRFGASAESLSPLRQLASLETPVMLIGGDRDRRSPPADTLALYQAAAGRKTLWLVPDAAHEDFYAVATEQYQARVAAFLLREFGGSANKSTQNSSR